MVIGSRNCANIQRPGQDEPGVPPADCSKCRNGGNNTTVCMTCATGCIRGPPLRECDAKSPVLQRCGACLSCNKSPERTRLRLPRTFPTRGETGFWPPSANTKSFDDRPNQPQFGSVFQSDPAETKPNCLDQENLWHPKWCWHRLLVFSVQPRFRCLKFDISLHRREADSDVSVRDPTSRCQMTTAQSFEVCRVCRVCQSLCWRAMLATGGLYVLSIQLIFLSNLRLVGLMGPATHLASHFPEHLGLQQLLEWLVNYWAFHIAPVPGVKLYRSLAPDMPVRPKRCLVPSPGSWRVCTTWSLSKDQKHPILPTVPRVRQARPWPRMFAFRSEDWCWEMVSDLPLSSCIGNVVRPSALCLDSSALVSTVWPRNLTSASKDWPKESNPCYDPVGSDTTTVLFWPNSNCANCSNCSNRSSWAVRWRWLPECPLGRSGRTAECSLSALPGGHQHCVAVTHVLHVASLGDSKGCRHHSSEGRHQKDHPCCPHAGPPLKSHWKHRGILRQNGDLLWPPLHHLPRWQAGRRTQTRIEPTSSPFPLVSSCDWVPMAVGSHNCHHASHMFDASGGKLLLEIAWRLM